jgi:hypothetical protein
MRVLGTIRALRGIKMATHSLKPDDLATDGLDDPWFEATEEELAAIEDAPVARESRMPLTLVAFGIAVSLLFAV